MNIQKFLKPLVKKIPGLAQYYRYLRTTRSLKNEVLYRDNLGFFFNGNELMEKGDFEQNETAIIESLLGFFEIFVNIGANTGYYVCKALSKDIPTIAFEPNPLNINILLKNIDANQFKAEFQFFPIALSDQLGVISMYGMSTGASLINGWAGQKNSYLVPSSKFDSTAGALVENKSCLVVIDIEGAELSCLKGANSILSSSKNNVFLIEIVVREHQPQGVTINPYLLDTFALMSSYGYKSYTADKNLRLIKLSEVSEIVNSKINTLGTINFLFVKDENILSKIIFKR